MDHSRVKFNSRRRRAGYWTQELHQLKLHHSVWCQLKLRLRCRLPLAHVIHRADQPLIPITKQRSLTDANTAVSKLRKAITAIHKESFQRRQEHLLDLLANISEDEGEVKRTQILHTMAKQEQQNEAYARLGFARRENVKQQNIN